MNFGTLGTGFGGMGRGGAGVGSAAALLLAGYTDGLSIAASDDSMVIKGTGAYAGTPGAKLTVARSGNTATRYNSSVLIEVVNANILRRDYDPRLSGAIGYLIEGARTNQVFPSDDWTAGGSGDVSGTGVMPVRTANYATSPAGTVTAARLQLDKGSGAGFSRYQRGLSGLPSGVYTGSLWQKTNDSLTKSVGLRVGAAGSAVSVNGSLQRYTQVSGTTTTPGLQTLMWDSLSTDQVADLATWGGQVELGGFASSYIYSPSGATARNSDDVSISTSAFPWSATVGSIALTGFTARGAGTQVYWQADDGSENNRFRLFRNSSNDLHFVVTNGGVEQCDLNLGALANNTLFSVSVSWGADDFAGSLNGGAAVTDSSGSIPTVTTFRIGSSFTGEHGFYHCMSLLYVPLS